MLIHYKNYILEENSIKLHNKNTESTTFDTGNNIKDIFLDLEKKLFDLTNFKKDNYEFRDFASVTKSSLKLIEKAFKKKESTPELCQVFLI